MDSLRILDGGRISIAALSVGIAQGAYEAALKYSKQRKQFSRFISEFQAIQHKLADMATEIDAARLLTLRAAWLKDSGAVVNKESAMAKLFASETAVRVTNEAVQIHGGYGFIKDYPVEKFFRDAKLCTIGEGTSEIQRLVIARQLLKSQLMMDLARKDRRRETSGALARAATLDRKSAARSRGAAEGTVPAHRPSADSGGHRPARGREEHAVRPAHASELRAQGKTVAILAVDPTSPYSGGAILGDRIRMQRHHADPGVFIRSMATRGWLGGLARATTEMTMLLDAAGFDVVIVETVGVGQDEVEIARLADVTLVVLMPGMGDDVQAIKAGIMEIADVFVINKADLPGADKLENESEGVAPTPKSSGPIASEGKGIDEALAAVEECRAQAKDPGRAAQIWSGRLREMLRDRLLDRVPAEEFLSGGREVAER